jgi:hypothetical protein
MSSNLADSNATVLAALRARRRRTLFLMLFFLLLMPLGCVVPCSLVAFLPEGTPKMVTGITGFALPLVGLVGFILMFSDRHRWKNALRVAERADAMGFAYAEKPPKADYALLGETQMYCDADHEACFQILRGEHDGQAVELYDYSVAYGFGTNASVYNQTVVVLPDAAAAVPDLIVFPKGWLNFLDRLLGDKQVDFSDDPAFHRAFVVRGDEPEAVRNVLTKEVRQMLLADPKLTVEVLAGRLFVNRIGKVQPPDKYPDLIDEAFHFARALQPA